MAARLGGIGDALDKVDRLRDAASWLRDNAPLVSSIAAGLLLLRPRGTIRWLRRGVIGWQLLKGPRDACRRLAQRKGIAQPASLLSGAQARAFGNTMLRTIATTRTGSRLAVRNCRA